MILDTCALLWLAQGEGELSETALQRIDVALVVYVSAISSFEIGIKVQKGKLALPARPADWFTAVLTHHNLEVLPLASPDLHPLDRIAGYTRRSVRPDDYCRSPSAPQCRWSPPIQYLRSIGSRSYS